MSNEYQVYASFMSALLKDLAAQLRSALSQKRYSLTVQYSRVPLVNIAVRQNDFGVRIGFDELRGKAHGGHVADCFAVPR